MVSSGDALDNSDDVQPMGRANSSQRALSPRSVRSARARAPLVARGASCTSPSPQAPAERLVTQWRLTTSRAGISTAESETGLAGALVLRRG